MAATGSHYRCIQRAHAVFHRLLASYVTRVMELRKGGSTSWRTSSWMSACAIIWTACAANLVCREGLLPHVEQLPHHKTVGPQGSSYS